VLRYVFQPGALGPAEGRLMSTRTEVYVRPRIRNSLIAQSTLPRPNDDEVVDQLRELLAEVQFGSVTLIVQDGRVIQIDTTRKLRLTAPGAAR
jgi:hypothetical protein